MADLNSSVFDSLRLISSSAGAGELVEEQQRTQGTTASRSEREAAEQPQRHGWEIIGPSPL